MLRRSFSFTQVEVPPPASFRFPDPATALSLNSMDATPQLFGSAADGSLTSATLIHARQNLFFLV